MILLYSPYCLAGGTEDKFLATRLLVHFRVWDKGEAVRRIASLALSFLSRTSG